ncbi:MAG: hypothetical protein IJQ39_09925 [Thermoguttaceae bacterium]|nr:hypothetical protein [Thermoguttaceae bacterium]
MYILGTDEAGYGPNLGPLVISVSVWTAERDLSGTEMYERLRPVVCQASNKRTLKSTPGSFLLDDSKKLYQGQKTAGLKHLEYALLSSLRCLGRISNNASFSDLFNALTVCNEQTYSLPSWEIPEQTPLPIDADKTYLDETTIAFTHIQEESGIHLTDLRSDVVFPARFNVQCDALGNKSTLLSKTTLNLLKIALKNCPGETVVWCDKHGGRNFYADLLNDYFNESPDKRSSGNGSEKDSDGQLSLFDDCEKQDEQARPNFVEILEQSESISSYRFTWQGYVRTIHFQAKSDCSPPAAMASIACKYLRELFMNQLNEYWQKKVPGLEPTAGYPVDAKRFLEQIRSEIDFPIDQLWRKK